MTRKKGYLMKFAKKSSILLLATLVSCSTTKPTQTVTSAPVTYRKIAGLDSILSNPKKLQIDLSKLMDGIFHSYIMGQVFLHDFDNELDKNPNGAMKSSTYSSLMSVRFHVDKFEHDFLDLYTNLVYVNALPEYSEEQKETARAGLKTISDFMVGLRADHSSIPGNLRPLILANIVEKQTHLYEEFKALHDVEQNAETKEVFHRTMVELRGSRMAFNKELAGYNVDPSVLKAAIAQERKKASYKSLEKDIKSLSKDMKTYISQIGRGTSADQIFPSAGANGNISGKNYPAKTWSITYDDGPAKTTPQVLKNLVDKKIPATFFVLAQQVEKYPATFKTLVDAKMDMASHSYTHAQMTKQGPAGLEKEIVQSKRVIDAKLPVGVKVKLFRLPYGAGVSVSKIRAKIAENDMVHVFWTVDTLDWQDKNPTSIFNRALKQMNASGKNAGIVLFHDIHPQSVTASAMLMDYMNKNGLITCTVQGVVDQINKGLDSCK